MASALIMTTVDKSIKVLFSNTDDPRVMWGDLQKKYDKVRGVDRIRLLGEVYTLQMKPGSSMRAHVDKALGLFQSLTNAGHSITPLDKKAVLLRSLPQEYVTTKSMLEHMVDYWSVDQFVATMLSQESIMKGSKAQPAANYAFEATRQQPRDSNSGSGKQQKGCYNCGCVFHRVRDCPHSPKGQQQNHNNQNGSHNRGSGGNRTDGRDNRSSGRQQSSAPKGGNNRAHVARAEEREDRGPDARDSPRERSFQFIDSEFGSSSNVLLLRNVTYAFATRARRGLACDSACTISCTGDKSLLDDFEQFEEDEYEPITLGDNSVVYGTGCGSLRVRLPKGDIKLRSCLYVPAFSISLLSMGQCRDEGYVWSSLGAPDTIEFYNADRHFLGSARRQLDGLYILGDSTDHGKDLVANYSACKVTKPFTVDVNLFHLRCGHFGMRTLKDMSSDPKYNLRFTGKVVNCVDCIKAKISQVPHPSHPIRSEYPLQRLYVDLQTDLPSGSLHKFRHALTIVDDASRFAVCEPLVRKSDAPEAIKAFILQAERKLNTTCFRNYAL